MSKIDPSKIVWDNPYESYTETIFKHGVTCNNRSRVIEVGVALEGRISDILCSLLGISIGTSKAFGNTSSSLSFHHRMSILSDLSIVDKGDKEIFQKFMEIRNKFAHIRSVASFRTCYLQIDGFQNWCKKRFDIDIEREEDAVKIFELICREIDAILARLVDHAITKAFERGGDIVYIAIGQLFYFP